MGTGTLTIDLDAIAANWRALASRTAQGVETGAEHAMLAQLGCGHVQGFGIARPMPAQALPGWVAVWRASPDWQQ